MKKIKLKNLLKKCKKDKKTKCLIVINPDLWGGKSKNYPIIKIKGKLYLMHRLMWTLKKGPIRKNLFICHKCDNPKCININHLWIGSQKDNMRDMIKKNRHNKYGLRGMKNPQSKLNDKQILNIRKLYSENFTLTEIAKKYNISIPNVYYIVNEFTWK